MASNLKTVICMNISFLEQLLLALLFSKLDAFLLSAPSQLLAVEADILVARLVDVGTGHDDKLYEIRKLLLVTVCSKNIFS